MSCGLFLFFGVANIRAYLRGDEDSDDEDEVEEEIEKFKRKKDGMGALSSFVRRDAGDSAFPHSPALPTLL